MQLKQYEPFMIDFRSKWVRRCGAAMGASLFLRMVCFLGIPSYSSLEAGQVIFQLVLPAVLTIGFLALFGIMRWNVPGIYAIVGAAMCLSLLVDACFSGSVLRIVLGVLGYLFSGALLVATVAGYLPGKLPAAVTFGILAAVRLVLSFATFRGVRLLISDLAGVLLVAGLLGLACCLKPISNQTEE